MRALLLLTIASAFSLYVDEELQFKVFDSSHLICTANKKSAQVSSYSRTMLNYKNCRGPFIPVPISPWKCSYPRKGQSCSRGTLCQRTYRCRYANGYHNRRTIKKSLATTFTGVHLPSGSISFLEMSMDSIEQERREYEKRVKYKMSQEIKSLKRP